MHEREARVFDVDARNTRVLAVHHVGQIAGAERKGACRDQDFPLGGHVLAELAGRVDRVTEEVAVFDQKQVAVVDADGDRDLSSGARL